ncbi:polyprenol reductase isoform X2 [Anabrus simplex]|uniref:polyprenol reductase isoform X2 n=1 Tax=Anabrus simplex TaxID=316456 RepID=UPI0035A266D7
MDISSLISPLMDMNLNFLKLGFIFMTVVIVILGGLMNTVEQYLPAFLAQTFRYGKFAYQGRSPRIKPIEVPKRRPHPWLLFMLDLLASRDRKATVSGLSVLLALLLLTLQAWHRFYETWFVSVFSNGRMNLSHYLVGYIHYFGSVAAILSEAPGFISGKDDHASVQLSDLTLLNVLGCILFLYACYRQYKVGILLANLRKNEKGQVVRYDHVIPRGDWFELVSTPHLFAEILMYLALTCVLWGASTWPAVFAWVFCNQVETGLLTHWWYQSKFKSYPKERKAIIPFVL